MEQEKSLKGRSFCPQCKHVLSWKDLLPVFSFVFLRGKCRYCKTKISWQYPLVELATGLAFLAIFNFQFSINFTIFQFIFIFLYFYIAGALIFIFVYDLKHYLIPDKVLFPAIFITLAYRIFSPEIINYIWGALAASGFFFLIWFVSRGQWMGFGDVKLAILMGLLLGLPKVLAALFIAFFLGAIIGVILMAFKKSSGWGMKSEMPFGPFLIAGTFIALFFGNELINWYLHYFEF